MENYLEIIIFEVIMIMKRILNSFKKIENIVLNEV